MNAPRSFAELLAQWPQMQEDINFLRSFRKMRFITSAGDTPLKHAPGSDNVVVDLRLLTGSGQPAPPAALPSTTTADGPGLFTSVKNFFQQGIASGVETAVELQTARVNSSGVWSPDLPKQFRIPAGGGGIWLFYGSVVFASNSTGSRSTNLRLNGTVTNIGGDVRQPVSAVGALSGSVSIGMALLAAGDYIELTTLQTSGASLNVTLAEMQAIRLTSVGVAATPANQEPEIQAWSALIIANSGLLASDSLSIATALVAALKPNSFYPKIKYFLPFLGANLAAARCPLIDVLGVGLPANTAFVDADFTQATGLKGNGTTKFMSTLIKPSQLGTGNTGGIGYWETQLSAVGETTAVAGCYTAGPAQAYSINVGSGDATFHWGNTANGAVVTATSTNGHYYGQRASATSRKLYKTGAVVATNTTSDSATGVSSFNIFLLATNFALADQSNSGRCGAFYLTDGTLTDTEIADLHSILQAYLITPTGR